MFGDNDWPLNASRGLSVIAEFLVTYASPRHLMHIATNLGSLAEAELFKDHHTARSHASFNAATKFGGCDKTPLEWHRIEIRDRAHRPIGIGASVPLLSACLLIVSHNQSILFQKQARKNRDRESGQERYHNTEYFSKQCTCGSLYCLQELTVRQNFIVHNGYLTFTVPRGIGLFPCMRSVTNVTKLLNPPPSSVWYVGEVYGYPEPIAAEFVLLRPKFNCRQRSTSCSSYICISYSKIGNYVAVLTRMWETIQTRRRHARFPPTVRVAEFIAVCSTISIGVQVTHHCPVLSLYKNTKLRSITIVTFIMWKNAQRDANTARWL